MTNTTKQTTITATIKLWAVPKNEWEIRRDDPQRFEVVPYLGDSTPYKDGSVELPYNATIRLEAAPYDCTAEGIAALEKAKADAMVAHAMEQKLLDDKIAELTCLVQLDT